MPSAAHLAAIEQKGDQLTLPFTGKAIVCKKKKNLEVPALPGQLRARNSAEGRPFPKDRLTCRRRVIYNFDNPGKRAQITMSGVEFAHRQNIETSTMCSIGMIEKEENQK